MTKLMNIDISISLLQKDKVKFSSANIRSQEINDGVLTYSIPPREGYNRKIIVRSVMKYPIEICKVASR